MLKVHFAVESLSMSVQVEPEMLTEPVIESPGETG